MSDLAAFLQTADPDAEVALAQAKAHTITEVRLVTADVLTMMLVQVGLYGVFNDVASNAAHPARDICLAVMTRLNSEAQFNFTPGTPRGDANMAMFDALIAQLMPGQAVKLTQLRQMCLNESGRVVAPFAGVTMSDILAIRNPGQEQEALYPSESYLVSTSNQGADVVITLEAPAPHDLQMTVYLATCVDSENQHDGGSFVRVPMPAGFIHIKAGESRGFLALGSRKIRAYNKFFIKPAFDVAFSALVTNNRG